MPTPKQHSPAKPPRRNGRDKWKLPDYCSSCNAKNTLREVTLPSVQLIEGEEVHCQVPKYQCSKCKASFMSPAQATVGVKIAVAMHQQSFLEKK